MRVPWRYLALLLAGCLWGNPAMAQDGPTKLCRASATNLIVQVIRATPDVHVYEFRGLDAELGIALYNSLPPVGHLHGDRFYILVKPGASISHLMSDDRQCRLPAGHRDGRPRDGRDHQEGDRASRGGELDLTEREEAATMIRKLSSGEYRLYSRKKIPRTGKRRNLGTFTSLAAAKKHERAVQYFKRAG